MALMLDWKGSVTSRHSTCLLHAGLHGARCRMNSILTETGKQGGLGGRVGVLGTGTAQTRTQRCGEQNRAYKDNYKLCCLKTH